MATGKTSADKAKALERESRALELRKARFSFHEIAESMGCSRGVAWKLVNRALGRLESDVKMAAGDVLKLELASLDSIEATLNRQVVTGHLGAIDRVLKVKDMRNRLLKLYPDKDDAAVQEVSPQERAVAVHFYLTQMAEKSGGGFFCNGPGPATPGPVAVPEAQGATAAPAPH